MRIRAKVGWMAMAAVSVLAQQPQQRQPAADKPREYVTAAASRDTAPRVGLIPSNFTGGEEMDKRKIRALAQPVPLAAALSAAQLHDMLTLAVELGGGRRGGLVTAIGREDWVVIKIHVGACPGSHAGRVTDPRLVSGVLRYLAAHGLGKRFSIVEGLPAACGEAAWDADWQGAFDGATYRAAAAAVAARYPALRIELVNLATAPTLDMPVEGRVFASRNRSGQYRVPRLLRECDKVISIAPLGPRAGSVVALTMLNYLGFSPSARVDELGEPGEVAVDLFSFHPADYAILGGAYAAEAGDEPGATRMRRHNVIVAGTNAPAVDAIGAAVMGLASTPIRHLELAVQQGYGINDAYSIWTRGVEFDEVKAEFRR
ncbi:MAG: DUF362 domain-containing protein [Bryobacterales bacterium]|nr:DUF362 domain-containing protein [Bryobacterales bacterium]